MTTACWLPDDCLESERVMGPLGKMVGDWSMAWLPGGDWRVLGRWRPARDRQPGWAPLRESQTAALWGMPGAVVQLALALLGEKDRGAFTKRDLKFLRRLANPALDDLERRLAGLFPRTGEAAGAPRDDWWLEIGSDSAPLVGVSASRADLSAFARKAFPRIFEAPLGDRRAAMAGLTVPISAHLGSATLRLTQLEALEPGDVLILDRQASEGARLFLADRPSPFCGLLAEHEARRALQLIDPN